MSHSTYLTYRDLVQSLRIGSEAFELLDEKARVRKGEVNRGLYALMPESMEPGEGYLYYCLRLIYVYHSSNGLSEDTLNYSGKTIRMI